MGHFANEAIQKAFEVLRWSREQHKHGQIKAEDPDTIKAKVECVLEAERNYSVAVSDWIQRDQ